MRILRVAQTLYPDVKGGGAYHVHAMSRDQAAMGHDVTVLTVRTDSSLPHIEERDGYTVVRYDPAVSLLGNDISFGVAHYLATADDFDVVHTHSHLYFSTNLAAMKRLANDIPLAITNHGLYSQTAPEWVFEGYLRTIGKWTFNRADAVFTYTEPEQDELRQLGVTTDIEIITNGIDTNRFTPTGSESDLIDTETPVILFVGRLVQGKRPVDAVRALAAVQNRDINATLYVAGTGPLKSEMESVANEHGIRESLRFLGHVPYNEMPSLYRAADVLALPSQDEGMPRTVLEAMASETPVLTSSLPQLQEIVPVGGKTVPIGDYERLGDALANLLVDDGSTTGVQGRKLVEEQFEWSETVTRTTNRLKSLAHL